MAMAWRLNNRWRGSVCVSCVPATEPAGKAPIMPVGWGTVQCSCCIGCRLIKEDSTTAERVLLLRRACPPSRSFRAPLAFFMPIRGRSGSICRSRSTHIANVCANTLVVSQTCERGQRNVCIKHLVSLYISLACMQLSLNVFIKHLVSTYLSLATAQPVVSLSPMSCALTTAPLSTVGAELRFSVHCPVTSASHRRNFFL